MLFPPTEVTVDCEGKVKTENLTCKHLSLFLRKEKGDGREFTSTNIVSRGICFGILKNT